MINETKRNIEAYKALLPGLKERVAAVALMLVMSIVMMTSASYAWLTISRAPEVQGMNTTIAGNGNLEIALVGNMDSEGNVLQPNNSAAGDSSATEGQTLLGSNITWGNLVNLSDPSYGLSNIALRPALLSGYDLTTSPLYGAAYGADGRVTSTSEKYYYASCVTADDGSYQFVAGSALYGVRAITSVKMSTDLSNAAIVALEKKVLNAQTTAVGKYDSLILNETIVSGPKAASPVGSMDALAMMMEIYVNEKGNTVLGNDVTADYSGVVTYTYRLMEAFQDVLEAEGEALLYLANMQIFLSDNNYGTEYYKTAEELVGAYSAKTLHSDVKLSCLSTFVKDYNAIKESLSELKDFAEACDPDEVANPDLVTWDDIGAAVLRLVDIYSATIDGMQIGTLSKSDISGLSSILFGNNINNKSTVVIKSGILRNTEARIGARLAAKDTYVGVQLNVIVNKKVYAWVLTDIAENAVTLFNADQTTTSKMDNNALGDLVAKDSYGMAIDLWVRTNAKDTVLTLEGVLSTEKKTATTIDKNGNTTTLSTMTTTTSTTSEVYKVVSTTDANETVTTYYDAVSKEAIGTSAELNQLSGYTFAEAGTTGTDAAGNTVDLYTMTKTQTTYSDVYLLEDDNSWYYASNHVLVGTDADLKEAGASFTDQEVDVVTGYDGVSRIWEDYLALIQAGLMAENNTAQGSGSCYVFYADPSEQTRILKLLEAFTVVFVDDEGKTLGTAKLDTEHYYSINGKTTVPLVVSSGTAYIDKQGEEKVGITSLEQNEATWITAIIYLDGMRLTNQDVLAVGEIEGRLNIQFGSSIDLNNQNDDDLRWETVEVTASAASGGNTTTNATEPIEYTYDGANKTVTVTLDIDSRTAPNNVSAFLVRSISATQGTKSETVSFTNNGDGTWTGVFTLAKPGTYALQNVIIDGSDYELDAHPTIIITGQGIRSVRCTNLDPGMIMTADDYLEAMVTAEIDAAAALLPKQVRALFRSPEGKEYTAILSYDKENDLWTGAAKILESGTYTLEFLVMDGEFFPVPDEAKKTYIVYLGLTAQVWYTDISYTNPNDEDDVTEYDSSTFKFEGMTDIGMLLRLYDSSGNEIQAMKNVALYYHAAGNSLDQYGMDSTMTWNNATKFYEGAFQLTYASIFDFDRVAITNVATDGSTSISTIRKATSAPTFTAISPEPPAYVSGEAEKYQFVPNGGATMAVTLQNAASATVWAVMTNDNGNGNGDSYLVQSTSQTANDDGSVTFVFPVPTNALNKQDGEWILKTVCLQNVYANDQMYFLTEEAPTLDDYPDKCLVMTPTDTVYSKVVHTVNVSITDSDGKEYTGEVFGKDANGNTIGAFMQSYNSKAVTIKITDWQGNAIEGMGKPVWAVEYAADVKYGGYTTTAKVDQYTVALSGSGSTYTAAEKAQTFQLAGKYTSKLTITVGSVTYPIPYSIIYEVWSVPPTVTISAISPTSTFDADTTGQGGSGHTSNGATASINGTGTEAWVYFRCVTNKYLWNTYHSYINNSGYYNPKVTLMLNGISGHTSATLSFNDNTHIYTSVTYVSSGTNGTWTTTGGGTGYTWGNNVTTAERYIGYCWAQKGRASDAVNANGRKTPAGTITADTLVVVYQGETFTIKIPTITINNPY